MSRSRTQPLVTIIIPCYNYGTYLKKAVDSVTGQTYKNLEIIILDDGSTDNTQDVVKKIQSSHSKIIYHRQENKGIIKIRNLGIDMAKGEYLLQLDADDFLDYNYVEETVRTALIEKADIVYTDYTTFGSLKSKSHFPEFNLEELKNHNFINISCLIRRSAIGSLRFDDNLAGLTHEDWDFFLGLCLQGCKAVKCSTTQLNYRIHEAARNNRFNSYSDKRKYVDVYAYVIDKQNKRLPEQFNYLTGRVFADWYVAIDDYRIQQQKTIDSLQSMNDRLNAQKSSLEHTIESIANSRKYRVVKYFAYILHPLTGIKHIKKHMRVSYQNGRDSKSAAIIYSHSSNNIKSFSRKKDKRTAVILHLFYVEMWPYFEKVLGRLKNYPYDLFVTVPTNKMHIKDTIEQSFPEAHVIAVPNRGRDVLPFLWLMSQIRQMGYENILKLHSKKSTHRTDGYQWLDDMVDKLIPSNPNTFKKLISYLSLTDTGLVGPAGHYISLIVNFTPNKAGLEHVLDRIFTQKKWETVTQSPEDYGFFEGTMFWARTDALMPIINASIGISDFQKEEGQIDATLAHSLERAFCIVPEILNKNIYEIDVNNIKLLTDYATDNIPDWSEVKHSSV